MAEQSPPPEKADKSKELEATSMETNAQELEGLAVGVDLDAKGKAQVAHLEKGLGRAFDNAICQRAGHEAGLDVGQLFYMITTAKLSIAVRLDCMVAYVTKVSQKIAKLEEIKLILSKCNLQNVQIPSLEHVKKSLDGNPSKWFRVAKGKSPLRAECTEYGFRGNFEQTISADTLGLISDRVTGCFSTENFDPKMLQNTLGITVMPGDILARVRSGDNDRPGKDVFGRGIPVEKAPPSRPELGPYVEFVNGEFQATRYGYLSLFAGNLSVLPPIWINETATQAYWYLLDDTAQSVTMDLMQIWLDDLEVKEGIQEEEIERIMALVQSGEHQRDRYLIAAGTDPIPGEDTKVEVHVDLNRIAGKEREDGSIDFHEVNFIPDVQVGQEVVSVTPATNGTEGRDVRGNPCAVEPGEERKIEPGENVKVVVEDGVEHYYSNIEGIVKFRDDVVSVIDILKIEGDVGFNTGNLEYRNDIIIDGNVKAGFSVKAGGDITVTGTVEPSAILVANGNITVGKGIVGRDTRVIATGTIRTQFVQEASVQSVQDIIIGNYAYHAFLRAAGKVEVMKSQGSRGGSVLGGKTWGFRGIDIFIAGTQMGTATILNAGLDPDLAKQLDALEQKIKEGNKKVVSQLEYFGLDRVDVAKIQKIMMASTGPRRKILARAARQLGEIVQAHQALLKERKELEEKMEKTAQDAAIQIKEIANPGVMIRLKKHKKKIEEVTTAPNFHIVEDELLER